MKQTKITNYLSFGLPFILSFIAWYNPYLLKLSYEIYVFRLAVVGVSAVVYVTIRSRQKAKIPYTPIWWLICLTYLYLVLNLLTSKNIYAGLPRFGYFLSIIIFFLIIWDGFRNAVLNRRLVLNSLFIVSSIFIFQALYELFSAYGAWWEVFGFRGEAPPYRYRVNSLMGPNGFVAYLNLFFPIALVLLTVEKTFKKRILFILWILLYLIAVFFASSRGGYLGAASAVLLLIALFLIRIDALGKFKRLQKNSKILVTGLFVGGLIVLALIGYNFLLLSSAHPSHGTSSGGISLNRVGIWQGYLNIFLDNPLTGAGIGRYLLGYFSSNNSIPPGWLPEHAHSIPIHLLAEIGFIGLFLIVCLLGYSAYRIFKFYSEINREDRILASGIIAGIFSLLAHSIFDEFFSIPVIIFSAITLLAFLLSLESGQKTENSRISFVWLLPLVVAVLTLSFWNLRPFRVISQSVGGINDGSMTWAEAATYVDRAVGLAPKSHNYQSQAAFFYGRLWAETGVIAGLEKANQHFSYSLEIEPEISMMWMNKSITEWYLGNRDQAIQDAKAAMALAPDEPVYHLNIAWFYESSQQYEQALTHYEAALNLSESFDWSSHPFWQLSETRIQALDQWEEIGFVQESNPDFTEFLDAIHIGNIKAAEKNLEGSIWAKSAGKIPKIYMKEALLAFERGDYPITGSLIKSSFIESYQPQRLARLANWPNITYGTAGWQTNFIPGVLQLSQDFGQFEIYEEISQMLKEQLSPEQMCELEKEYTLAISGGQLWQEGVFIPSMCD